MAKKNSTKEKPKQIKFRVRYNALRPPLSLESYQEALSFARNNVVTKETGSDRERKLAALIEPYEVRVKLVEAEL